MAMKLYGFWRSLATCRARVALALKGIEAQVFGAKFFQR